MAQDFTQLRVWQESYNACKVIYKTTTKFPKSELFWLTDQLRRASISIVANIAEWAGRKTPKDFGHFLAIAQWSVNEVSTMILLAHDFGYIETTLKIEIIAHYQSIWKMLTNLQKTLKT